MAVTKRTRYEVLRRDNHTCRYCGESAPDVKITVDHVTPTALGGSDKPDNLVAACKDCNAGKTSTSPDAATVASVSEDQIRWAAAIKVASDAMLSDRNAQTLQCATFLAAWRVWDGDLTYLPLDWAARVGPWLNSGIPELVLLDSLDIALGKRSVRHEDVFRYLCGIIRNRLEELQQAAQSALAAEDA